MNEIVFVRRTIKSTNCIKSNKPTLKLHLKDGRFSLNQKAVDILGLKENEGIMFGFNKSEKSGYVMIDNEFDSYYPRKKDKSTFRFSSNDLKKYFVEVFGLDETIKNHAFEISGEKNKKGLHKIIINLK